MYLKTLIALIAAVISGACAADDEALTAHQLPPNSAITIAGLNSKGETKHYTWHSSNWDESIWTIGQLVQVKSITFVNEDDMDSPHLAFCNEERGRGPEAVVFNPAVNHTGLALKLFESTYIDIRRNESKLCTYHDNTATDALLGITTGARLAPQPGDLAIEVGSISMRFRKPGLYTIPFDNIISLGFCSPQPVAYSVHLCQEQPEKSTRFIFPGFLAAFVSVENVMAIDIVPAKLLKVNRRNICNAKAVNGMLRSAAALSSNFVGQEIKRMW